MAKAGYPYPHSAAANQYARDVVSGKIVSCKWVKLACQRHLNDLEKSRGDWPYEFNESKADRACSFIELLPHTKGEWAKRKELIKLEPWQKFIIATVFGWVKKDSGLRRFKTVYDEIPRKNAKSTVSAGVGNYMFTADGEEGAECYSAATTRDQAKIVWQVSKDMARKSPEFCKAFGVNIQAHNLHVIETGSKYEALSAEGDTLDGLNIHFACVDELHAHRTREVYDVLETATGSRQQPLLWCITTAGTNRAGICYEVRTYLTRVLDGVVEDDSFFGIIYTIDDGDDWADPAVWAKANPNYGVSVNPEDIARKCKKALQMPSAVNNFLTKHLNVWVNADSAWMDMRAWEKCGDPNLSIDDFSGEECVAALDLSSKVDIADLVTMFQRDGHYYMFCNHYLPESAIENNANSQYEGWAISGRIQTTPGNVIDYGYIEDDLRDLASRVEVVEVPYDPFQATQFSQRMMAEGFPMVEMRPTVLNFSEPMKNFEALVLEGKLHHDGDPVLAWMVSNVVGHLDNKDNIYPKKERPENKIDGVVAGIMALGRMMLRQKVESIYEKRGLTII